MSVELGTRHISVSKTVITSAILAKCSLTSGPSFPKRVYLNGGKVLAKARGDPLTFHGGLRQGGQRPNNGDDWSSAGEGAGARPPHPPSSGQGSSPCSGRLRWEFRSPPASAREHPPHEEWGAVGWGGEAAEPRISRQEPLAAPPLPGRTAHALTRVTLPAELDRAGPAARARTDSRSPAAARGSLLKSPAWGAWSRQATPPAPRPAESQRPATGGSCLPPAPGTGDKRQESRLFLPLPARPAPLRTRGPFGALEVNGGAINFPTGCARAGVGSSPSGNLRLSCY
ncbi:uncharacterized protein RHO17_021681 [Thomomys bottae]